MSDITNSSYLASVIGRPRGSYITADNQFRRYAAALRTESIIGGLPDHRNVPIYYEVGRHHSQAKSLLKRNDTEHHLVESSYPTSNVLSEEFLGLAKKYSNFSASFQFSNLAGVAERLAKALGAASLYPNVDSDAIRGGAQLRINALSVYDGPVNSLVNTVFIPRIVDTTLTGSVFAVLANAIAGEGASIATDVVELDATTRQPILGRVDDGLARSIVEALRIVGSNMQSCSQGPLFATAVTRGIHEAVSVVGHTDEAGITRDLFRTGKFAVPFGGIHTSLPEYCGLPALSTDNPIDVAAYVDSLALTTAALVSHCDPGIEYNGYWFPTFYNGTSEADKTVRPGQHQEPTQQMARRNAGQYISNVPRFLDIYTDALGKLFGITGDNAVACSFLGATAVAMDRQSRHFLLPTLAPYYWIEPTSLIPHDFVGSRAEAEGCGSFATACVKRSKKAWESIEYAGTPDNTYSAYHAIVRNPRSAWFFAHWLNNPSNGLGAVSVRQLDSNTIIQPGPCEAEEQVRDRVENGLSWNDFLWRRGQSPLCAPGELLNLGGTVGFLVNHMTMDTDGIPVDEHLPTMHEFLDTFVTVEVGRPNGLQPGPSNHRENGVRRARTQAAKQLSAATARVRRFGRPDVAEMPTMNSAPVMSSSRIRSEERGDAQGGLAAHIQGSTAGGSDPVEERRPTGLARPVVPHYEPQRYPQVTRPGLAQGGGAAPLPGNSSIGNGNNDDNSDPPHAYAAPPAQGDEPASQ